jgi:para-aminobenzoate synthetase component I
MVQLITRFVCTAQFVDFCAVNQNALNLLRKLVGIMDGNPDLAVLHAGDRSSFIVAIGVEDEFVAGEVSEYLLESFQNWLDKKSDWAFGWIAYDVKNCIEKVNTNSPQFSGFPVLSFFRPSIVLRVSPKGIEFLKSDANHPLGFLIKNITDESLVENKVESGITLTPRMGRAGYIKAIQKIKQHIQIGDIYEVNYCQEFYAEKLLSQPFETWIRLYVNTEAPNAAFVRRGNHSVLCASPERYLKREGNKIISQPIKGTIRRGKTDEEDLELKNKLFTSKKDRAENVMIVDLVRNDLSKSALENSVEVTELFGVHSFKTVHHLVSTIQSQIPQETSFTQLIKDTFPMGSMTGAPKIRAMEIADQNECSARGVYSGTIGYINPSGDFDFNVVIRSLVCNADLPYLSCHVGGAITALSDPEQEYEECLLKAAAVLKALV